MINIKNLFDGIPGLDVRTKVFGINSDNIYVSDGFDGPARVGVTNEVTIGDTRLKFIKGICVEITQNNGGD